jgi:hypothetical protein
MRLRAPTLLAVGALLAPGRGSTAHRAGVAAAATSSTAVTTSATVNAYLAAVTALRARRGRGQQVLPQPQVGSPGADAIPAAGIPVRGSAPSADATRGCAATTPSAAARLAAGRRAALRGDRAPPI